MTKLREARALPPELVKECLLVFNNWGRFHSREAIVSAIIRLAQAAAFREMAEEMPERALTDQVTSFNGDRWFMGGVRWAAAHARARMEECK